MTDRIYTINFFSSSGGHLNGSFILIRPGLDLFVYKMNSDECYEKECSAMGLIARKRYLTRLNELLANVTNYCFKYSHTWYPFPETTFHLHIECLKALIDTAYDNDQGLTWSVLYKMKKLLVSAADYGHLDTVKMLLDSGLYSFKDYQRTIKASLGNPTLLSWLLSKYTGNMNLRYAGNCTLLHMAVESSPIDSIKILLSHGIDVEAKEDRGKTALHLVFELRFWLYHVLDVVKLLVENGSNVDSCDNDGSSVLLIATKRNYFEIVEYLLHCNANPYQCISMKRYCDTESLLVAPICAAAEMGYLSILELLSQHSDKNILKEKNIWSPLESAISGSKYPCLLHLLENGYSLENDCSLSKALHYFPKTNYVSFCCLNCNDKHMLNLLLKSGAHVKALANCYFSGTDLWCGYNKELFLLALQCGIGESFYGGSNVVSKLQNLWNDYLNSEPIGLDFLNDLSSSPNIFHLLEWMPVVHLKNECVEITAQNFSVQFPSLTCLCRYYIRYAILTKSGCVRQIDIHQLSLPSALKDFLWLKTNSNPVLRSLLSPKSPMP